MAEMAVCRASGCDKTVSAKGLCRNHRHREIKYGDPLGGGTQKGEPLRWIEGHVAYEEATCLIWPFARRDGTYGRLYVSGFRPGGRKHAYAHRVMCEMAHGAPPTRRHEAAHSCGKGHEGCVNPKHLRWATVKENAADRRIHGTENKGIRNGQARLTENEVRAIRNAVSAGNRRKRVAALYGVSRQTVDDVVNGRRWGWFK